MARPPDEIEATFDSMSTGVLALLRAAFMLDLQEVRDEEDRAFILGRLAVIDRILYLRQTRTIH